LQQLLGGHLEESGDEKIWSALKRFPSKNFAAGRYA
jgi:hypothetical protein